jgi:alpha-1,3-mannosyl-glycoprotein beta-1,2-N-acetylglucosaminyltransferase
MFSNRRKPSTLPFDTAHSNKSRNVISKAFSVCSLSNILLTLLFSFVFGNLYLYLRKACQNEVDRLNQALDKSESNLKLTIQQLLEAKEAYSDKDIELKRARKRNNQEKGDSTSTESKRTRKDGLPFHNSKNDGGKDAHELKAKREEAGRVISKSVTLNYEPASSDSSIARALLIICYNRPDYLKRTLENVLRHLPSYNRPHIYISQDGSVETVTKVIQDFKQMFQESAPDVPFTHLHHPADDVDLTGADGWATGYYKLSQHFRWALNKLFNEKSNGGYNHPRVIILEDDIQIAPDFFDYFTAIEPILESDSTLMGASAWNDLGQKVYVADPTFVRRSDFFGGLGWMLSRHIWEEIGPKWPKAFWDDWLREPQQRLERHFLTPEVSRTYTFGEDGVSHAQFFQQYLGNIHLNDQVVDWSNQDLSYLEMHTYDHLIDLRVKAGKSIDDISKAFEYTCPQSGAKDQSSGNVQGILGTLDESIETILVPYSNFDMYRAIASKFGFIDDIKANVPRTSYKGFTILRHNGCRKIVLKK